MYQTIAFFSDSGDTGCSVAVPLQQQIIFILLCYTRSKIRVEITQQALNCSVPDGLILKTLVVFHCFSRFSWRDAKGRLLVDQHS